MSLDTRHPRYYLETIKRISPFSLLDEQTIESVIDDLTIKHYPPGKYVFKDQEKSTGYLYMVLSGKAEVMVKKGAEEVKGGEKKPYNFFGEAGFFAGEQYLSAVKAADDNDLICLAIEEETFEFLSNKNPEFSQYFLKALGEKVKRLDKKNVQKEEGAEVTGSFSIESSYLNTSIKEVMNYPVIKCNYNDSVQKAAKVMKEKDVSSVVVVDDNETPLGIITEKDLVNEIVAKNSSSVNKKAKDVYNNMFTLSPGMEIYHALILMIRKRIKHLVITKNQALKGIITIRDLIGPKRAGLLSIIDSIEKAVTIEELKKVRKEIDILMEELVEDKASSRMICTFVTEFFDRLTYKVIEICETEMADEGYGLPPVKYSFINMGSSGRREQFITTDQDNGIIYQDSEILSKELDENAVQNYFLALGDKIIEGLYEIGFEKCPGKVMANNPKWCRSFSNWKSEIENWMRRPKENNIRRITIFLDFRHIYGEKKYSEELKKFTVNTFKKNSIIQEFLAKDDLKSSPPIGFFNQIKPQKDKESNYTLDLKKSACVHIVDCVRIFSLREGVLQTNTHDRINLLRMKNVFSLKDAESIKSAYEVLMMLRIKNSINKIKKGKQPDNKIILKKLTKKERESLKEALTAAKMAQNLISYAFLNK
ncbi:DUF294 nucleotidyltransferase-like domain-containing protein [Natranaerofaba carboxydovora]|uniref:DUF294 nucleotidyltransferase-like domain-containing protein n=1 Tax=Natranaerofaba carboxydovora TaxID=2742683 RepID=UPI001F14819D|nr:DUF294 nucleotidyltransferase-like domain-containing protein [Natranaerofaba carboxydovora]UMZ72947.1 hypothetical protein ACONDI_00486 [Natranaerofaba carboxydovora]